MKSAYVKVTELNGVDLPLQPFKNLNDILAYLNRYPDTELEVNLTRIGRGVFITEAHYEELTSTLLVYSDPDYAKELMGRDARNPTQSSVDSNDYVYWIVNDLDTVVSAVAESEKDVRRIQNKNKLIGVAMSLGVFESLKKLCDLYQNPERVKDFVKRARGYKTIEELV